MEEQANEIKVMYLVIDSPVSYKMIIWCPIFNYLDVFLSALYLCMKHMLSEGQVGVI